MYAIVRAGGRQEKVAVGDTLTVDRLAGELGLDPATARRMVHQTILGAAVLLESSGESAETLRRNVTSPNGTTAAAIATLDQLGAGASIESAIVAARDRSRELSGP